MDRINVLIVVAVVVAAAGSAFGVLTYEDSRGSQFRVAWRTLSEVVQGEQATLTGAGEAEVSLPILLSNVTSGNVTVAVANQPGALAPTSVRIEIAIPGFSEPIVQEGEIPTASPGTTFVVPVDIVALPNATTVRGSSPEAAETALGGEHTSILGRGNWTVLVSLSPTVPDPLGAVQHTVDVTAELLVYEPELTVLTPEVER